VFLPARYDCRAAQVEELELGLGERVTVQLLAGVAELQVLQDDVLQVEAQAGNLELI
jgi:hypothetical protein